MRRSATPNAARWMLAAGLWSRMRKRAPDRARLVQLPAGRPHGFVGAGPPGHAHRPGAVPPCRVTIAFRDRRVPGT
jgi:hypothetical protein